MKEKHIFEIDTEWTYRPIKRGATTVKVITVQKVTEIVLDGLKETHLGSKHRLAGYIFEELGIEK